MTELGGWITTSPADDFWAAAIVLLALSAGGFLGAFYCFARKRTMENTPTSKIRSAAQGYVELSGRGQLLDGPPITAPLTGRTCTWYSYRIEEYRRSGKRSHWVTIDRDTSEELFLLADDTGRCIIDPEGASVTTLNRDVWYGSSRRPERGPRRGGSWMNRGGRWLMSVGGRYRYSERRLHPGEPLYAIGLFKTVGGSGSDFDTSAEVRELLAQWKQNSSALLRAYDTNRDGELDLQEWQQVRDRALEIVMQKQAQRENTAPVNTLGATRDVRRPFLLSALSQADLIRRLQHYAGGGILLFFLCGALATWMISVRLGP